MIEDKLEGQGKAGAGREHTLVGAVRSSLRLVAFI